MMIIELTVPPGAGVIGFGIILTVTARGRPEIVRFTGELNLPIDVTVTVRFPQAPSEIISGLGLAVIVKSLGGVITTSPTDTLCVISGRVELPVIVRL